MAAILVFPFNSVFLVVPFFCCFFPFDILKCLVCFRVTVSLFSSQLSVKDFEVHYGMMID